MLREKYTDESILPSLLKAVLFPRGGGMGLGSWLPSPTKAHIVAARCGVRGTGSGADKQNPISSSDVVVGGQELKHMSRTRQRMWLLGLAFLCSEIHGR